MDIYHWIVALSWLAFIIVWFVSSFGAKKSVAGSYARSFGWRLAFLVVLIVLASSGIFRGVDWSWLTIVPGQPWVAIGAALSALGVAFAIWARVYLGSNWGMPMTLRENPELVTEGPYKYVRHPIYTGMLAALIGSVLVSGLAWVVVLVIVGGYFLYSARREERDMLRQFPDAYPAYKARTRMLIPFIL